MLDKEQQVNGSLSLFESSLFSCCFENQTLPMALLAISEVTPLEAVILQKQHIRRVWDCRVVRLAQPALVMRSRKRCSWYDVHAGVPIWQLSTI